MRRGLWLLVTGLALLAGVFASVYLNSGPVVTKKSAISLDQIILPDLDGKERSLGQWKGKVLLVNFWATWCPPCREEIPVFLSLRNQFSSAGFEVVGISIDDVYKVIKFRDAQRIDYPLLSGEQKGMSVMASLGNRMGGLPFSILYDRSGNAVDIKTGAYEQKELLSLIEKLL